MSAIQPNAGFTAAGKPTGDQLNLSNCRAQKTTPREAIDAKPTHF